MKKTLDMTVKHKAAAPCSPGTAGHATVIKGQGGLYKFPTDLAGTLTRNANVRIRKDRKEGKVPKAVRKDAPVGNRFQERTTLGGLIIPQGIGANLPSPELSGMIVGADAFQRDMVSRQYDFITDKFVGQQQIIGRKAALYVPSKLQNAVAEHNTQLDALQKEIAKAVPEALIDLRKQNPDVPSQLLLQHVVDELNQQLAGLLSVLGLYTMAWLQYGDPSTARILKVLNFYMESQFRLYQTGDLDGTPGSVRGIPTSTFGVGDAIVSALDGMGLGTIPGTKGPIKVHLLLVPRDMVGIMINAMPLLSHEGWHQVHNDVKGLAPEMLQVIPAALIAALKSGELSLSTDTYKIGRWTIPAIQGLIKFFTDTIGETGSDILGGVASCGHAFGFSMFNSFPALSIRDGLVRDAKQWLRTTSVYTLQQVDENSQTINFEVHPQDWIRARMVGFACEEIGFTAQGKLIAAIADEAVNGMPQFCSWADRTGKSQTIVSIPSVDLIAAAKIVMKVLVRYQFASLTNGTTKQSVSNIVCFTPKMLGKAEAIRDALLKGERKLPSIGTVHTTYIAAGNSLAYWEQSQKVSDMMSFKDELADNTMSLYEELELRLAA